MDSNSTQICRLCRENSDNLLNIYENYMRSITIAEILTQHFWFQVDRNDGWSEWLCEMCWINVKTFHNFYKKIEHRHGNNWKSIKTIDVKSMKQEPTELTDSPSEAVLDPNFLKQTDGPGEAVEEPDLNIVKCEETQLTAVYICTSKEDTCDYNDENSCDQSEIMEAKDDEDRPSNVKSKNYEIGGDRNDGKQSNCEIMEASDDEDRPSNKKSKSNGDNVTGSQSTAKVYKNSNYSTRQEKDEQDALIRQYFTMKCEICDEVEFETILEAKRHYRRVHNKEGYLMCCGGRFAKRCRILEHIHLHSNPDAYRCDQCNKNFRDKRALQLHMRHHIVPARSLKCNQCSKSFRTAASLNYHVEDKHFSDKGKTFSCDICSKSFSSKLSITSHIRSAHRTSEHVCEICARRLRTRQLLQNHISYVHSTTPLPKAQCDICGAWLKHESSLQQHLKSYHHTPNVEVQCSICDKVIQNKKKLRNHIRTTHGDRWRKCVLCDKALKTALSLKEHMARHTGEDLYSCAYCERKFKSNGNMFAHRKKVHAAEWTRDYAKRRQNNESEQEVSRGTEQVEKNAIETRKFQKL